MLSVTDNYRNNIYAASREFRARAVVTMDALSQNPNVIDTLVSNFVGKTQGSLVGNSNISKFRSDSNYLRLPTDTGWTEITTQDSYNKISTADTQVIDIWTSGGNLSQQIYQFDVIAMLQNKYGSTIWKGKTALADKVAIAESLVTKITGTYKGWGQAPPKSYFAGFRYIRDWVNGSTANTGNHWVEVQCLSAGTNRCQGRTPTSNHTLTNATSITDFNTGTYGYDNSNTGAAYAQIDLGSVMSDIDTIKIYHYFADGRTYHGTKTEVSVDGTTWTTIFDSAVSGEYAETSAGKTYTPTQSSATAFSAKFAWWNGSAWSGTLESTSSWIATITQTLTGANIASAIGSDGYVNFLGWSQASNVNVASEFFTDYIEISIEVTQTNWRQYDDSKIVRLNVVEEINVLNDSVPSDEMQITLNNEDGTFNMLNFGAMSTVLASKPQINVEMGLVYDAQRGANKLENPDLDFYPATNDIASFWTSYNVTVTPTYTGATGYTGNAQQIFVPSGGVGGINSGYDFKAVKPNTTVYFRFLVYGTVPNYVYLMKASGNQKMTVTTTPYDQGWTECTGSIVSNNTANEDIGILIGQDTRTTLIDTTVLIDSVWFSDYAFSDTVETVEYLPLANYIVTQWNNDITNKVITFTCNDYFAILTDISYGPSNLTNPTLDSLARDVLAVGGVPADRIILDSRLATIPTTNITEATDCRTVLQNIAIAARVCVFQDRYGNVVMKTFQTIDQVSNYLLYTRTQNSISGNYAGGSTYSVMSTGAGMKNITYDSMYDAPEIQLDTVVYQLVVNSYALVNGEWVATENLYTNPTFSGQNGQSFKIDNPLILTKDIADKVAAWYFAENNYNAEYRAEWRGNPALECTDMVLVQDPFGANKQSRIFRQEFNYEGYLEGTLESRGGV